MSTLTFAQVRSAAALIYTVRSTPRLLPTAILVETASAGKRPIRQTRFAKLPVSDRQTSATKSHLIS